MVDVYYCSYPDHCSFCDLPALGLLLEWRLIMAVATYSKSVNTSPFYSLQLRRFGTTAILTLFTFVLAVGFLLPFANMALLSVKTKDQIAASQNGSVLPMEPEVFNYQGADYPVYNVPFEGGATRQLALVKKGRQSNQFVDPTNPDAGTVEWKGNWRQLDQVTTLA